MLRKNKKFKGIFMRSYERFRVLWRKYIKFVRLFEILKSLLVCTKVCPTFSNFPHLRDKNSNLWKFSLKQILSGLGVYELIQNLDIFKNWEQNSININRKCSVIYSCSHKNQSSANNIITIQFRGIVRILLSGKHS